MKETTIIYGSSLEDAKETVKQWNKKEKYNLIKVSTGRLFRYNVVIFGRKYNSYKFDLI